VDHLQPALLLVCLVSTVAFAVSASGSSRTLAGLVASCLHAVLVGSAIGLVPSNVGSPIQELTCHPRTWSGSARAASATT
jgi:hypothetical protein